jgi:hypothetical protein
MYTPDPTHRRLTLDSFEHHTPNAEQVARIELNRSAFKTCADVVLRTTAPGRDQRAALRKLHEGLMTANKAVVLEESQLVEASVGQGSTFLQGSTFGIRERDLSVVGSPRDRNPGV